MDVKTIGVVAVILLLAAGGLAFFLQPTTTANPSLPGFTAQNVSLRALATGLYDKDVIRIKAGIPVEFSFSADPESYCGTVLWIPEFNVKLESLKGETQTATFTPKKPGEYAYRCPMNMFRGKIIAE